MHEVSLGQTIRDYLTGEAIDATTYEDLRQALARMLVEERGYPRERLVPRIGVHFPTAEGDYCRTIDLAVLDATGAPLLIVMFCPGQVNTFARESLAAARLVPGGPAPLVAVTDMKDAALYAVADGALLAEGLRALPRHGELASLVSIHEVAPLTTEQTHRERCILHAYSEFLKRCCNESVCML